jgi:hypothetical protein
MAGEKKDEKPQGFLVVLESCQDRRGKSWSRIYLSKIGEPKQVETCFGPDQLEIMRKAQKLLLKCRRVHLIMKPYPEVDERSKLIQNLRGYYPEIKVVNMSYI